MPRALVRTACRIAARRLLNKALQMRKEQAGSLLQSSRAIKSVQIKGSEDFGLGCHTASSEPYFYDSAYQHVKRDSAIPVSEDGKCIIDKEIEADSKTHKKKQKQWECSSECKPASHRSRGRCYCCIKKII